MTLSKNKKTLLAVFIFLFTLLILFLASCNKDTDKTNNYKWWQKTNAYEVYVKSFNDSNNDGIGDINGISQKLDYLQSLNVGALWITPVYSSPMVDNGYDISDYRSINEMYGNMSDMDNLISKAKDHNIKIVMDLVMNHTSDMHEWFKKSCESKDNEYSDYYIWRDAKPDGSAPNNWRSTFGGSAWTWNEQRGQYYLHTFASQQPDLNWSNEKVRKELQDIANFWLDKGVGGFRVDACVYFKKPVDFSDGVVDGPDGMADICKYTSVVPGIFDYLHEFKDNVTKGKDVFVVGEAFAGKAEDLDQWVGKDGVFDMLFQFGHMNVAGNWYERKEKFFSNLKKFISETQKYSKDGWCPIFFENHDSPRSINAFFPKEADSKLAAKAMSTVLLGLKGTPFIFQGEEIGMTNASWTPDEFRDLQSNTEYELALKNGLSKDAALEAIRMHARDNGRTIMQWNPEKYAGFSTVEPWIKVNSNYRILDANGNVSKDSINVVTEESHDNSVLNFYKKLIDFRQNSDVLLYGDYEDLFYDNENILAFKRTYNNKSVVVIVNFSNKEQSFDNSAVKNMELMFDNIENTQDSNNLKATEARVYVEK